VTWFLTIAMLFVCLALAACADNDKRSDDSRYNGWYGGVAGGAIP
jgi:opacity protein-like surface antigen